MNDTSDAVAKKMRALMLAKSGVERIKMGASMFDTAKQITIAVLKREGPADNLRARLFLRFYGGDYNPEQREKIVKYFSKRGIKTQGT